MRKLFIFSTVLFWLSVAGFWLDAGLHNSETINSPAVQSYSMDEVMRHQQINDCWMVISGEVYDVSAYLPSHPSSPAIINAWCGKEATLAWQTKTRGRPHSAYAASLLPQYRIGVLQPAP